MNRLNKKARIGLLSGVLIIVVAVVIIFVGKSIASTDSSILRNQTVGGLSFENATLEYKDGVTTYTVDVYNENKEKVSLKNIEINFKQEDDTYITLTGYIGNSLDSDEGKKMQASVDLDLTNSTDIEFNIVK